MVRCLYKATCGELLSTLKKKKGLRAIFNRVLQVILGGFNFVLLRSVIGSENSRLSLNQSNAKLSKFSPISLITSL